MKTITRTAAAAAIGAAMLVGAHTQAGAMTGTDPATQSPFWQEAQTHQQAMAIFFCDSLGQCWNVGSLSAITPGPVPAPSPWPDPIPAYAYIGEPPGCGTPLPTPPTPSDAIAHLKRWAATFDRPLDLFAVESAVYWGPGELEALTQVSYTVTPDMLDFIDDDFGHGCAEARTVYPIGIPPSKMHATAIYVPVEASTLIQSLITYRNS